VLRNALLLALVCACGTDWRTDLWYQQGRAARETPLPEPEGAVPLHPRPQFFEREDADGLHEAFPADAASIARGRVLFEERCVACHGADGHGGGPLAKKGFPPAPDLAYTTVVARSDGFIYATLILGGKAMPRIGEGLDDHDRWDLVHVVRRIQGVR
jgi:mono/diheme cytochrome c family protein